MAWFVIAKYWCKIRKSEYYRSSGKTNRLEKVVNEEKEERELVSRPFTSIVEARSVAYHTAMKSPDYRLGPGRNLIDVYISDSPNIRWGQKEYARVFNGGEGKMGKKGDRCVMERIYRTRAYDGKTSSYCENVMAYSLYPSGYVGTLLYTDSRSLD